MTGIVVSCELPRECWKRNVRPMERTTSSIAASSPTQPPEQRFLILMKSKNQASFHTVVCKKILSHLFLCMGVLSTCMPVIQDLQCLWKQVEGTKSSGARFTFVFCHKDANTEPDPLSEKQMLLAAEPSLQPLQ